ncbi:hypothetical protein SAMN06265360_106182 [Haloechinothrix alba]|uniref:APA family basic amino acid/polyamine antiporter n=1 Tax=Haloechinothrix alba TaxID=664784 RepID=A0A238WHL9_9PSEU|nr:hypothetical protein [Haloechinothrix alba]SNR46040.1 hypothetical protein SAMN06265360_106182 [Haloechinothrix alba]
MLLGAGLLVGIAAGAAAGGWWMPGGLVLAGLAAAATERTRRPAWPELRATAAAVYATMLSLTFATYLVPGHAAGTAVVLVAVTAAAVGLGWTPDRHFRRLVTALLLAAAVAFVAVCLAIRPVGTGTAGVPAPTVLGVGGDVIASGVVLFALFAGLDRGLDGGLDREFDRGQRRGLVVLRPAGAIGVAVAVAGAALYQLGPARLGLSPAPVRDVLVAADAGALVGVAHAVVALATVTGMVVVLAAARDDLGRTAPAARHTNSMSPRARGMVLTAPPALLAAALAVLPTPRTALLLASSVALIAAVLGCVRPRGAARPACRSGG